MVVDYDKGYAVKQLAIFLHCPNNRVAHSNSVALQFRSFGTVGRLKKRIGRTAPSFCSCSTTAPSLSTDASVIRWKSRPPGMAAKKSGNGGVFGLDNRSNSACTICTFHRPHKCHALLSSSLSAFATAAISARISGSNSALPRASAAD